MSDDPLASQIAEALGLDRAQGGALCEGRGEGLSEERTVALIGFDVDAVQAHLFASPRPVTIEGASFAIREWDKQLRTGALDSHVVPLFAGGGTATLLAPWGRRAEVESALRARFQDRVPGASCSIARLQLSPRELALGPASARAPDSSPAIIERAGWEPQGGGGFGGCMRRLQAELRRAKSRSDERGGPHPPPRARCEECTVRLRQEGSQRCSPCETNRQRGRDEKARWDSALSFEDVVSDGELLGFVKLDGKGIGACLGSLQTVNQYWHLSRRLLEAFLPSLDELRRLGVPEDPDDPKRGLKVQRSLAGGDDLLLVVPARWRARGDGPAGDAFALAAELAKRAERVFQDPDLARHFPGDQQKLLARVRSIGAGVGVLASRSLPARYCFEVVDHLVESAKDAITGVKGARSAVDFAVLRGGAMLSDSLRQQREGDTKALDLGMGLQGRVRMTARPYTLDEFDELLAVVRGLPAERAALYGLRQAMQEPSAGMIQVRYQLARNPKLRQALLGEARLAGDTQGFGPWVLRKRGPGDGWVTSVPDLLELVRLVTRAED